MPLATKAATAACVYSHCTLLVAPDALRVQALAGQQQVEQEARAGAALAVATCSRLSVPHSPQPVRPAIERPLPPLAPAEADTALTRAALRCAMQELPALQALQCRRPAPCTRPAGAAPTAPCG